jgi:hypothetical protein
VVEKTVSPELLLRSDTGDWGMSRSGREWAKRVLRTEIVDGGLKLQWR